MNPTFSVTVSDLIGPLAPVALGAPRQSLGAHEVEANSIHAGPEAAAVAHVSNLEVAKLVGALLSRLSWLCGKASYLYPRIFQRPYSVQKSVVSDAFNRPTHWVNLLGPKAS